MTEEENTTFIAPNWEELRTVFWNFPNAGMNMSGKVVDLKGLRGDPVVRQKAIDYIVSHGWPTKPTDD